MSSIDTAEDPSEILEIIERLQRMGKIESDGNRSPAAGHPGKDGEM